MQNEIWKDIVGYEGLYQVSNMGRVKSLERIVPVAGGGFQTVSEKILSQSLDRGYLRVTLSYCGIPKRFLVHVLVGNHFLGPVAGRDFFNHRWGNKLDNRASELERCTRSENELHAYRILGKKSAARKAVLDASTGEVFESIFLAASSIGMKMRTLSAKLNGQNPNDTNFIFR